jgi:ectoine hydroxylase
MTSTTATTQTTSVSLQRARQHYVEHGWCAAAVFDDGSVAVLRDAVARLSRRSGPEVVYERDSRAVRAIHGCHAFDDVCERLTRVPCLVDLAEALVGAPVYVYQFKVNLKLPHDGAAWPWHQDYTFWKYEDGMPAPDAVNIGIFLDPVTPENGPLVIIPGSHRLGIVEDPGQPGERDWRAHVSADLTYTVSQDGADDLAFEYGLRAMVGPAGTAYAFHPSIVHCSSSNTSDDRRALLLITYNAVHNAPPNPTRPGFLVNRDTRPVERARSDEIVRS